MAAPHRGLEILPVGVAYEFGFASKELREVLIRLAKAMRDPLK